MAGVAWSELILSTTELRIAHWGQPFDGNDVRGICGIAESTKNLTSIGRFGIGFKSVYAFTDHPEVHSGDEDFAIESFVWPIAAPPADRQSDETTFVIPLRPEDANAHSEVSDGLQRLGPRTLLFLRQIEEIDWSVAGGPSGLYLCSKPEVMGENVRRITVIGQEEGEPDIEETWLVFSREARTDQGAVAGHVEIAFSIIQEKDSHRWSVQAVSDSPLVVFFPTVLQTHLGFLVQGPYRTTPSRDNVPLSDPWNQHLVKGTATLLVEALRWLRDHDLLDTTAPRCLPLDRARFGEGTMFAPLFDATRVALVSEPLLPRFGGSYVPASNARLARTQELRELFGPSQLATMFAHDAELAWLSGDITQDRTPDLRQYLMHELDIAEVTPEMILPKLDKSFLEAQPDGWVCKLYEFLNGQPALRRRLDDLPLIRLEDGAHVPARSNGQPQAFLPSAIETGFPTVRRAVCTTDDARKFLQSLDLTEPDPVDDVVWNVLPRYSGDEVDVHDADYEADIRRILAAFGTDSKTQRDKLLAVLRESSFVMAVDAGDGSKRISKPGDLYLATERLKNLFAGVTGVFLVDDSYACLRGEPVRELLEATGAARQLQPVHVQPAFSWEERREMRRRAGHQESSGINDGFEDYALRGLELFLASLPSCEAGDVKGRARHLWDELGGVESRQGKNVFSGAYTWTHYGSYEYEFDSAFVRQLNSIAWVPGANGDLQRPEFVVFGTLDWKPNPFLLSKIRFKPPIIETLAKEAGIEPGLLDLLKKLGVTSEAELKARLGIKDEPQQPGDVSGPEPPGTDGGSGIGDKRGSGEGGGPRADTTSGGPTGRRSEGGRGAGNRTPGSTGGRPFISYVGAHPDEKEPDPDGLDQPTRMALEEKAITLILADEPHLRRTPTHNPGYDLFETGEGGQPARWIEVKAMSGSLSDRPVGLSRTQFECARDHRDAYWLYIVEHAGDDHSARILRIQDPAGKARTFTFDRGWIGIAEQDGPAH